MIRWTGFLKGDQVEFQDYRHCWTRGTVQHVEPASVTQRGPSGDLVEAKPAEIHILYRAYGEKPRVIRLNPKRVRAVNGN